MGLSVAFPFLNAYNNNAIGAPAAYSKALSNKIFAAPQGVGQIDTFAFDYQLSNQVVFENNITDHWLEDNTAVQDHIAVKPNTVTLRGYVAELVLKESIIAAVLGTVQNTLSQAGAYLGKYTPGATQALAAAIAQAQGVEVQISQALSRAAALASLLPGLQPNLTRQQGAVAQLKAYRDARVFFTVYTPFEVYFNMAILSVDAIQPEKSKDYSEITVKMKQLNFITTVNDVTSPIANNSATIAAIHGRIGNISQGFQSVQ